MMKPADFSKSESRTKLVRYLSPLGVFALAFGCSVGWGSFVMPGTTFLPTAGPLGTLIGIIIGAAVMFVIGANYAYLMNRYPDSGGTYSFVKNAFGYDHGFLASWFMILVYMAIIWANSTALPLVFRALFGDLLQFGYLYTIAGYDVYIGEILLSFAALLVFGFICLNSGKIASWVQIVLVVLMIAGITVGLLVVVFRQDGVPSTMFNPAFSPDQNPAAGTLFIVLLAPWAFAGFESVSHSAEEFKFPVKKALFIMTVALVVAAAAYIFLLLIGSSSTPEGYSDWASYVREIGSKSGVESIPVFQGIRSAAGTLGLIVLGVAAGAAIITGLVGNMTAASRMIHSMARDDMIPRQMGTLSSTGVPKNAVAFLILLSLPIPFLGRSAIGWVVDINTIGVTIAYAYTSAAAFKESFKDKNMKARVLGLMGAVISLLFLAYFLIPNSFAISKLATESYLMLIIWVFAGFIIYFWIFKRDKVQRMGRSVGVWAIMLLLIFTVSFIWIWETSEITTETTVTDIEKRIETEYKEEGLERPEEDIVKESDAIQGKLERMTRSVFGNTVFLFAVVIASMLLIFYIYRTVQKRHQAAVREKTMAEESSQAKSTFLSNMSHDIRTPMNAIVGYVALAKREKNLTPAMSNYLNKIESSSDHLLALINDVLEMSRIESGRMELSPVPSDWGTILDEVRNLFSTQMEAKGLEYIVSYDHVPDMNILCDGNRMNRVLLNLVSNAYKFTPEGGTVSVILEETGREGDSASYCLRVKDTGIGMSKEFAAKVFEAYERERTTTVEGIQGTGLGTAITKSIVDLMGGTIDVESEQGKGTEFIVRLTLPLDPAKTETKGGRAKEAAAESTFAGMKLLLVDDDPDNREVEQTLFEEAGFIVDIAENGEEAVEMIASSAASEYSVVIMDIEMPVKNGYEATKLIRSLKNESLAKIPIVAVSAKAFSEDIAAARKAGMNAHIAKPLNMENLRKTLSEVLLN